MKSATEVGWGCREDHEPRGEAHDVDREVACRKV